VSAVLSTRLQCFLRATVISVRSPVRCIDLCVFSGLPHSATCASDSGAQHDVPVSSTSCSRSLGRVKILQETNKGSCTLRVDLAETK
jgi:hypothetical protein